MQSGFLCQNYVTSSSSTKQSDQMLLHIQILTLSTNLFRGFLLENRWFVGPKCGWEMLKSPERRSETPRQSLGILIFVSQGGMEMTWTFCGSKVVIWYHCKPVRNYSSETSTNTCQYFRFIPCFFHHQWKWKMTLLCRESSPRDLRREMCFDTILNLCHLYLRPTCPWSGRI